MTVQKTKSFKELLALGLAAISILFYSFPLVGIILAVAAYWMTRNTPPGSRAASLVRITRVLAILSFVACVIVQIYLLASFKVG